MFTVRLHGRGGHGVVAAAETLAFAAFSQGDYSEAFPGIALERAGVPMTAFCRIDDAPIRRHEPVLRPDALIVQDSALLTQVDVLEGYGRTAMSSSTPPTRSTDSASTTSPCTMVCRTCVC